MGAAFAAAVCAEQQTAPDDDRTLDQVRADAMVGLITGARSVARRVPQVAVLIDDETLRKGVHVGAVSETEAGPPVPAETVRRLACDAEIIPIVLDFPRVGGKVGRPKELPDELYADAGYDSEATRWLLAWLGIEAKINKRRTAHGSGLGKVRWVVERTISWLKGLRRMRIRYDRLKVVQEAWNTLAASVICFRIWHHDFAVAS